MINVSKKHREIVLHLLTSFVPHCEVRAFGSRVNGVVKPYSDLDVAIVGKEKLSDR